MTSSLNDQFADMLERIAKRVRNGDHERITVEFGPYFGDNIRHDVLRFEVDFGLRRLDDDKAATS